MTTDPLPADVREVFENAVHRNMPVDVMDAAGFLAKYPKPESHLHAWKPLDPYGYGCYCGAADDLIISPDTGKGKVPDD